MKVRNQYEESILQMIEQTCAKLDSPLY